MEERLQELEESVRTIQDDLAIFKQNLTELSNLVETECVNLQTYEREIRFLKTIIEETIKK